MGRWQFSHIRGLRGCLIILALIIIATSLCLSLSLGGPGLVFSGQDVGGDLVEQGGGQRTPLGAWVVVIVCASLRRLRTPLLVARGVRSAAAAVGGAAGWAECLASLAGPALEFLAATAAGAATGLRTLWTAGHYRAPFQARNAPARQRANEA